MGRITLHCPHTAGFLEGFASIRTQFDVPERFPPDVVRAAEAAAARPADDRIDRRDIEFVAIDPAGSRDLDQAFHAHRRGSGYRVHYAIADVSAFVSPGGAVDEEARRRGLTFYSPDAKASLHPEVLNQDAGSLLPDTDRPALLWTMDLGPDGAVGTARVERALVRIRAARSYADVQSDLDAGRPDDVTDLLREIGTLREQREIARGGVSLNLPDQEVVEVDDGFDLHYRDSLPVEGWNAQISLMTGMAAAKIMVAGGVGIMRSLPPPDPDTLRWLQRSSRALGVPYDDDTAYGDWVRSLDTSRPREAALLTSAARGFRGAGYTAFDGRTPVGADHAAIASPYAHVTAPLRRLIDRFDSEIVLALSADRRPPGWVLDAIERIPEVMTDRSRHERRFEKALVDYAEAMVLSCRIGETFPAIVTGVQNGRATLQLKDPAVIARLKMDGVSLGEVVRVRLGSVEPRERRVDFSLV
ncbi:MAG: RNB domain-containing ribonuclease [Acidimicrobiia bacterium]